MICDTEIGWQTAINISYCILPQFQCHNSICQSLNMSQRRFTFTEACIRLGIGVERSQSASEEESEEEDVFVENAVEEDRENDEDLIENNTAEESDDGGEDLEIFEEMTDSEDSSLEEDDEDNADDEDEVIMASNGTQYTTRALPNRRRRRNILTERGRPLANPTTEQQAFGLFVTEEILRTILMHTNRKVYQVVRTIQNVKGFHRLFTMFEVKAALAIIIRAGSDRDNFTELANLWQPGDSKPFYRAVLSQDRVKFFLRCIRFDNCHTRQARKMTDKFAAISEIWDMFLSSLRRSYICNESITIDEQLLGYRGAIPGRTYIPSKPRKYGLKIFWACEYNTGYALNAILYGGKDADGNVHRNLGQEIVLKLCQPFYETGRNICTDNFFTSFELSVKLLQKSLTLLGTVRQHRREIPHALKQRMELYDSKFLFNEEHGIVLVTYQAKRNKMVTLLSSSHTDKRVADDDSKKPLLILDYNKEKGGVDMFDENLEEFSCRRKTVRWPLLTFYNILDVAVNNFFLLMKANGYSRSRLFCTDNFFTSFELSVKLLQKSLTLLGTVRQHRREIPHALKQRMELG